jgi:hypothetical protein
MSTEKLIQVKLKMAAKYEHRATLTSSKPLRRTLMHHAKSYRDQASDLTKLAKRAK